MNTKQKLETEERLSIFQVLMLLLSVYALGAIFVQSAFKISPEVDTLLERIDFLVCAVFLFDFGIRLYRAPSKLSFMKWGWIDLVSSIPKFEIFRVGRMLRIIRILRMFRAFRSAKLLVQFLFANRAKSALTSIATISTVLAIFASIAILNFETSPESNIKTPTDALWWAATTITTAGSGDKYPVTSGGRVVAVFLMVAGVGLFGTFTGFIASLFIEPEQRKEEISIERLECEVKLLRLSIQSMETQLRQMKPEQSYTGGE